MVAQHESAQQKQCFESWCLIGDWSNPYHTYTNHYVKRELQIFYKLYEKGYVYRDLKPVYWSPSSRTALAEAELEYKDKTSPSIYIKFPLNLTVLPHEEDLSLCVWTTTPWTVPVNAAICYHPHEDYAVVNINDGEHKTIIAVKTIAFMENLLKKKIHIISTFKGCDFGRSRYINPLREGEEDYPLLPSHHVTVDKGTGLVHTAPAHGPEDFLVGLQHKLPIECSADEYGKFTEVAGAELSGLDIHSEGNNKVMDLLSPYLLYNEIITHSVPHD